MKRSGAAAAHQTAGAGVGNGAASTAAFWCAEHIASNKRQ